MTTWLVLEADLGVYGNSCLCDDRGKKETKLF